MEILEKFASVPDLPEIHVKDMELTKFRTKFSDLAGLLDIMRARLPDGYKHYLVDLIVQDQRPGLHTCRDIRWHVDGDFRGDNKYVLWVRGPNRTEFPSQIPQLESFPEERHPQNEFLEKTLCQIPSVCVPDMTLVRYDSRTPHRGVKCKESGVRTFVRMLASNYIRPKLAIKESFRGKL